jgi:hypothetical protein
MHQKIPAFFSGIFDFQEDPKAISAFGACIKIKNSEAHLLMLTMGEMGSLQII